MSQTILGIDLGTYSVKVLQLMRRVQELHVLEYIEEPLNLHSRLPHEELIAVALDKIFSNHILDSDVVSVGLPGYLLSSRILELPFTGTKRIGEVIDFELESYIPFPVEEIFSDFHILNQSGSQSQVLCVYTHEDNFKKYIDNIIATHIEPKYFGADFTDLATIAQVAIVPHEGYYAICDIGHSGTNLLIMKGSELKYVRTLGIGGYHFTRAIQRSFNINQEKAEAIKLSRGKVYVRHQDLDQVSRILTKVATELASSMKQTILGAKKFNKDLQIQAIYCCGGGSRLMGMLDFLSFHLRTNVFELDVLNFLNHQFEEPEEVNTIIPQVLSTAIRPIYSNKAPKINFRKGPYAYKQDIQLIASELKSIAALLIVIILLGIGYYFYADYHYSKKMASLHKRVEAVIKKDFQEIKISKSQKANMQSTLRKYLKSAQSKLKEVKAMTPTTGSSKDNVVTVMYDISKYLPSKKDVNFEVKEFNFSDDFVRIDASTNDTLNVEKIVAALQDSEKFSNIESTDAQPKPGNIWDFTLKLDLKKP